MKRATLESTSSVTEAGPGLHLEPEEIVVLACLMHELRDLTLSRRTFTATTRFLQRIANENGSSPPVHDTLVREYA
jgi:hypothetical protein